MHFHFLSNDEALRPKYLTARLQQESLVDRHLDALIDTLPLGAPVGLSVPFPGNLYGALRIGRALKARGATVWMGGGYVNTELRDYSLSICLPRFFPSNNRKKVRGAFSMPSWMSSA